MQMGQLLILEDLSLTAPSSLTLLRVHVVTYTSLLRSAAKPNVLRL